MADDTTKQTPAPNGDAKKDDPIPSMQVPPPPGQEKRDKDAIRLARVSAIRDIGRAVARVVSWLLVFAIFAGIFYGITLIWPDLLNSIANPIAANTDDITALQVEVETLSKNFSQVEAGTAEAQAELTTELQAELDAAITDFDSRIGEMETLVADYGAQIEILIADVEALQNSTDVDRAFDDLNTQLLYLRAWQELAMARIRLSENNLGLAGDSLSRVIATLNAVYETADTVEMAELDPILARLNSAAANLDGDPFIAFSDLDAAWAELSALVTPATAEPEGDVVEEAPAEGEATEEPPADGEATEEPPADGEEEETP